MTFFKYALTISTAIACLGTSACVAADDSDWRYQPENNHVGRIYYYERTNTDGSLDERITMFRRDETSLEVYKENGLCRNAALVTADLNFETFTAPRVTGGMLLPEAEIREFAFLNHTPGTDVVTMDVMLPDMEINESAPVENQTWHLFDFDMASVSAMTPHLTDPDSDFGFGMALVWADPSAGDPFTWMGEVAAAYTGHTEHLDASTRHYALTGSAFDDERATGSNGDLWLDAADGHVVDAVFPAPNHPGYTDFRLRLLHVSDGGAEEWDNLLRAHWNNCE